MIPLLDVDDAIAEVHRVTELGMKASFLPIAPPFERPPFANEEWDPLWAAMEEVGMVLGFHVGTEPHTPDQRTGVYNTGRQAPSRTTSRPPTAPRRSPCRSSRRACSTATRTSRC